MGASSSRASQARSSAIDRQLEEESLRFKKEVPILVLGTHETSKSTLVKHMKLVHGGFTPEELAACRSAIHTTVIEAAQALVLALQKRSRLDGMLAEEHRHLPETILRANAEDALSPEFADAIEALWRTTTVTRFLDDEVFTLPDSAFYFFTEIQRLAQPQYIPTENDVLRAPAQKSTVTETRFNMGTLSIRLIDVGPLRSERRKWIHCFESVTSIIFCTALSDYDQVLLEERGLTRMHESLVLFDSIVNSRWFMRTSIILFFTEIDVFRAKMHKIPLSTYFPEYTGGPDINKAAKYILWRFMQENRARLSVYPHPIAVILVRLALATLLSFCCCHAHSCALTNTYAHSLICTKDTKSVRLVFAAVKETILQNALKDSKVLETQVL
ncbi:Heterotrimeric G-protein alpha subunit [Mycena sanguinolenta]|uniref:Heterotrimeric G-protein alpha subunit n=1 Tax=Mycena sanguinolenta TaxID=230812 RepID=A0A8H6X3T7_9AGAR|nr:Heterotrimeric G-protein alpha subunit [Mycena sanguinolenta]